MKKWLFPIAISCTFPLCLFSQEVNSKNISFEQERIEEIIIDDLMEAYDQPGMNPKPIKIKKDQWIIHRNQTKDKTEKFAVEFPGYGDIQVEGGIVILGLNDEGARYELRFFGNPKKDWKYYDELDEFTDAVIDQFKKKLHFKVAKIKAATIGNQYKLALNVFHRDDKSRAMKIFCIGTKNNAYLLTVAGKDMSKAKYFFKSLHVQSLN